MHSLSMGAQCVNNPNNNNKLSVPNPSRCPSTAMGANRINKFIDNHTSNLSNYLLPQSSSNSDYDPSLSWDGLSVDPRPFSRFDSRPTRIAPGTMKPIGLSGSRVIELEQGQNSANKMNEKQARGDKRRYAINARTSAQERLGYNPFHHNETLLNPNDNAIFQNKNCAFRPIIDTHSRLFVDRGIYINPGRTQNLRNRTLDGKDYNITNGTLITTLPSTVAYTSNKLLEHPSQNSVERGRNMQGFLDMSRVTSCATPVLAP